MLLILSSIIGTGIEKLFKQSALGSIPQEQLKIVSTSVDNPVTKDKIEEIKKFNYVDEIIPIYRARFPVTSWFEVPTLDIRMFAEPEIIGIPDKIASSVLENQSSLLKKAFKKNFPDGFRKNKNGQVPILLTSFIEAYSSNFAQINDVSVGRLIGLPITLDMGTSFTKSHVRASDTNAVKCLAMGFAPVYITMGVAMPMEELGRFRKKFLPHAKGYDAIFIRLKHAEYVEQAQKELEEKIISWGYKFDEQLKDFKNLASIISTSINIFDSTVLFLGLIILGSSMMTIFYAFSYIVIRREKEIGLFRFFGSTKPKIMFLILFESALVGLLCALSGIILSYLITIIYLPDFETIKSLFSESLIKKIFMDSNISEKLNDIFVFDWVNAIWYGIITSTGSIIAAFIPSLYGSNVSLYKSFRE